VPVADTQVVQRHHRLGEDSAAILQRLLPELRRLLPLLLFLARTGLKVTGLYHQGGGGGRLDELQRFLGRPGVAGTQQQVAAQQAGGRQHLVVAGGQIELLLVGLEGTLQVRRRLTQVRLREHGVTLGGVVGRLLHRTGQVIGHAPRIFLKVIPDLAQAISQRQAIVLGHAQVFGPFQVDTRLLPGVGDLLRQQLRIGTPGGRHDVIGRADHLARLAQERAAEQEVRFARPLGEAIALLERPFDQGAELKRRRVRLGEELAGLGKITGRGSSLGEGPERPAQGDAEQCTKPQKKDRHLPEPARPGTGWHPSHVRYRNCRSRYRGHDLVLPEHSGRAAGFARPSLHKGRACGIFPLRCQGGNRWSGTPPPANRPGRGGKHGGSDAPRHVMMASFLGLSRRQERKNVPRRGDDTPRFALKGV
jgi:hypothetical protein